VRLDHGRDVVRGDVPAGTGPTRNQGIFVALAMLVLFLVPVLPYVMMGRDEGTPRTGVIEARDPAPAEAGIELPVSSAPAPAPLPAASLLGCAASPGASDWSQPVSDERCRDLTQWAAASVVELDEQRTLSPYFFVASDDPTVDALPLKQTEAEVDIAGHVAEVRVRQVYRNEGTEVLDAVYVFPASTRAAIHGMWMRVGEREVAARIKETEEAREDYEQALDQGKTASLLVQHRPNVFQMLLGNILPGDEVEVELAYVETLAPVDGEYEYVFPTVVGPRYSNIPEAVASEEQRWVETPVFHEGESAAHTFGLELDLRAATPVVEMASPSHEIVPEWRDERQARVTLGESYEGGNRDFVFRYRLAGGRIDTGLLLYPEDADSGYFLLTLEPPARVHELDRVHREYVFILDVSGSMNGFPIEVTKALMAEMLAGLRLGDTFNVVLFEYANAVLFEESQPASEENVARAMALVDAQRGGGGTELVAALERALELPTQRDAARVFVIATDGYVQADREAIAAVQQRLGDASFFAFGIGSSVNRYLVEGLAHVGRGEPYVALDEAEGRELAGRFAEEVGSPLLRDVAVSFDGFDAHAVTPASLPDLFANRPLTVLGRYEGAAGGTIVVTGATRAGTFRREIAVADGVISDENAALRLLWARDRIRHLSDLDPAGEDELAVGEVTDLGLEHGLMTQYTSFVAVDQRVRARGHDAVRVDQPLPLPQGVSDLAVGDCGFARGESEEVLGALGTAGKGAGGHGYGSGGGSFYGTSGLGSKGKGAHGGGSGSGYGRGWGEFGKKRQARPSMAGDAIVLGAIDKALIDRVIKQRLPLIRYCYVREAQKDPGLSGKVVVRFVIGRDGHVVSAEVTDDSTLDNAAVEQCICKKVLRMKFPLPEDAGTVIVTYPFTFWAR